MQLRNKDIIADFAKKLPFFGILATLLLLLPFHVNGQEFQKNYTVGYTLPAPHFLEKTEDGDLTGYEAEIWQEAARKLNIHYRYQEFPSYSDMVQALEKNKIDFALGMIALDPQHNQRMVFSFPYFISGQGIMVRRERPQTIHQVFSALETPVIWQTFLLFMISTIFFGHIIWFIERNETTLIDRHYFPGVLQGIWCIFSTKTTVGFGDVVPRDWKARLIIVPAWLVGLLLITVITAQYITVFSQKAALSRIDEAVDLAGRSVAVLKDSASADTALQWGMKTVPVDTLEQAYDMLLNNTVDAIVHDHTPLTYGATDLNKRRNRVRVLGPFNTEIYAFPMSKKLAQNEPQLRIQFSDAVQSLYQNGFIDQQRQVWLASTDNARSNAAASGTQTPATR